MLLCGFWFPDFFSFEPAEPIDCNPKEGSPREWVRPLSSMMGCHCINLTIA